jgi:transposase
LNSAQIDHVVIWVKETNPGKTKEVREYIKDHFKISYSNEAVRKLLKKMGLKILRPKVVPGNPPSEEEQKKKN